MTQSPERLARTLVRRARQRREEDSRRIDAARAAVVRVLGDALARDKVRGAWLIGSAGWGEPHGRSDVDIVVEGLSHEDTAQLWDRLSQACGFDVDLLRLEELDASFRERVLSEGVEVDGA
jgi:predicted nucleotidyltransferase